MGMLLFTTNKHTKEKFLLALMWRYWDANLIDGQDCERVMLVFCPSVHVVLFSVFTPRLCEKFNYSEYTFCVLEEAFYFSFQVPIAKQKRDCSCAYLYTVLRTLYTWWQKEQLIIIKPTAKPLRGEKKAISSSLQSSLIKNLYVFVNLTVIIMILFCYCFMTGFFTLMLACNIFLWTCTIFA